jgi:hypothetical protein
MGDNVVRRSPYLSLEGQDYIRRLLDPTLQDQAYNCRKIYRMSQSVFLQFTALLRREGVIHDSDSTSVEQKLGIFLVTVGQDQRYGVTCERFGRSAWSVSKFFNEVLDGIMKLGHILVAQPSIETHDDIKKNNHLYPYFKVCSYKSLNFKFLCFFIDIEHSSSSMLTGLHWCY